LRSLGIVGLDYCGSTVVSNVISSLPGVINVGESHWILDRGLGCRECHNNPCPVFTRTMLEELRAADLSKETWWEVISRFTDAELIVSTDKLPKHYDHFGVPDNLLFLYKEPKSNIASWCKRKFPLQATDGSTFTSDQVDAGVSWWIRISLSILDWLRLQEREISTMSLEQFSSDPKGMTSSLCGWLGIEFDPSSIDFWNRDLHYIGGNHSVKRMNPDRHFYQRIVVDDRWRKSLSQDDSMKIDSNEEIIRILGEIEHVSTSSRSSFFRVP